MEAKKVQHWYRIPQYTESEQKENKTKNFSQARDPGCFGKNDRAWEGSGTRRTVLVVELDLSSGLGK